MQLPQKSKTLAQSRTVWSAAAFVIVFTISQFVDLGEDLQKYVNALEAILGFLALLFMRDAVAKSGPVLIIVMTLTMAGCHSPPKLKSVKQCLRRVEADYSDKTLVKIPDERVRQTRLAMIRAALKVAEEASK
jgi:hypothetical protein